jgi:uncharacterized protein (TIGR02001 family)
MNWGIHCLVSCALFAPLARAAAPQWGGSVAISSNYLQRGVSHSSNDPALSAEGHVQLANGLFAAVWASTSRLRSVDTTTPDVSATLGVAGTLAENWSGRVSVTHYESPWSSHPSSYRYDEFTADLNYRDRLFLAASYSPNTSRYAPGFGLAWRRSASAFEATYQQAIRGSIRGFVGIGYYSLDQLFNDGYGYASLGASFSRQHWQMDMSYVMPDTTARRLSYPGLASRRILATLAYNF